MWSLSRSWKRFFLPGMFAVMMMAVPLSQVQAAKSVTVGMVVWIGFAPFYVADALDTYRQYGLQVKLVNFADNAVMPGALQAGAIDGAMLTYDMVIGSASRGWPFRVVMPIDYSNGGDAIIATKAIESAADLKGKRVAYNPLSPSDFLLAYALQTHGLTEADIRSVHMSPEAVPAAMIGNAVEVGVTYEPNVSSVVNAAGGDKFHVILSTRDAPGLITDVLVFKEDYISKNKDIITALIRGYLDALEYMRQEPEEAARLIARAMEISPEDVLAQMEEVHNPGLDEMMGNFEKSEDILSFHVNGQMIGEILLAKGQIDAIPDIGSTLDDQFVQILLD